MAVCFFQQGYITFGTVELDAGLGELVQGLGQVQGLHTAQLGTHSFHSLYSSTLLELVLRIWSRQIRLFLGPSESGSRSFYHQAKI
jgi:hypothetical protein